MLCRHVYCWLCCLYSTAKNIADMLRGYGGVSVSDYCGSNICDVHTCDHTVSKYCWVKWRRELVKGEVIGVNLSALVAVAVWHIPGVESRDGNGVTHVTNWLGHQFILVIGIEINHISVPIRHRH